MSENNKSYRIHTDVDATAGERHISVNLNQDFDILEVLSLKLTKENIYRLHTSKYGCIVGRVVSNGGFGVENAKISMFIEAEDTDLSDPILSYLYPYQYPTDKNSDGVRYNLLPEEKVSDCHQAVGTFPSKRMVLDDNNIIEVFDKYYKYTTTSNGAGDYMLFGIPTGEHKIHIDVDLSDVGAMSQKPRDMVYKGYNINLFENGNMFKKDTNLNSLAQIISKDATVNVNPFWGEEDQAETIGITRKDIDIDYKFEPTCIFMGSIITDEKSNGFTKKCIATERMGKMDKLTTGAGTIEMIRKKPDGSVESFQVKGNQLIDGNGAWCYQIPMNLDYMMTDEYGNLVPTDDPEKGIPTRTRVRFRVSLNDFESDYLNCHLSKLLVPNNPKTMDDLDYVFGTDTVDKEDGTGSFRDLFWNNVYTVKSYIPRIQKGSAQTNKRFSGIKAVNVNSGKNPIPYNNIRINLNFMFTMQCAILKMLITFISFLNAMKISTKGKSSSKKCTTLGDGICPDLADWYFAPKCPDGNLSTTLEIISEGDKDEQSVDGSNNDDPNGSSVCVTNKIDYLMQCIEINLAMEYEVIQFDFYNDWLNGVLYIPRWFANIKKKKSFLFGLIHNKGYGQVQACMEDTFDGGDNKRHIAQQCALEYSKDTNGYYTQLVSKRGCGTKAKYDKQNRQKCHRGAGRYVVRVLNGKGGGGLVHDEKTLKGQSVYYFRPCEWKENTNNITTRSLLFATDIVLLGSLNDCDSNGIPQAFKHLTSSSFQMPTNLASTNMDSEGYMYGKGSNGTFCKGKKTYNTAIEIQPQTWSSYKTWSTNGSDDFVAELSNETPETESAGIDWGYTGPNQGNANFDNMYYPGGHFLSMACSMWNTMTNVKSCINLARACEAGAQLSQRITIPYSNSVVGSATPKVSYVNAVPSGLISFNDISDVDFRTMFATLNFNGLATKKDAENGYRKYDFISISPINFNGDLRKYTEVSGSDYNRSRGDNTQMFTQTLESASADYYRFRMGLKDGEDPKTKYLSIKANSVAMPVYENSYYFYFGIVDGSTAFDKFMSDYYAQCPTESDENTPSYQATSENTSLCTNDGSITVNSANVTNSTITLLGYVADSNGTKLLTELYTVIDENATFTGLSAGNYTIRLSGDNILTQEKVITIESLTPDVVSDVIVSANGLQFPDNTYLVISEGTNSEGKLCDVDGNVIVVDNIPNKDAISTGIPSESVVTVSNIDWNNGICGVALYDDEYVAYVASANVDVLSDLSGRIHLTNVISGSTDGSTYYFQTWKGNNDYSVKIYYRCNTSATPVDYVASQFEVDMNIALDLMIGDNNTSYKRLIEPMISYIYADSSVDSATKVKLINFVLNKWPYIVLTETGNQVEDKYITEDDMYDGYDDIKTKMMSYISSVSAFNNFTEIQKWCVREALYYTDSAYNANSRGSISVYADGGTVPYTESLMGYGERYDDDGNLVIGRYDAFEKTWGSNWSMSLTDFAQPTKNEPSYDDDPPSSDNTSKNVGGYNGGADNVSADTAKNFCYESGYKVYQETTGTSKVIINEDSSDISSISGTKIYISTNSNKKAYSLKVTDAAGSLVPSSPISGCETYLKLPSIYRPWCFRLRLLSQYTPSGDYEFTPGASSLSIVNGITYKDFFGDVTVNGDIKDVKFGTKDKTTLEANEVNMAEILGTNKYYHYDRVRHTVFNAEKTQKYFGDAIANNNGIEFSIKEGSPSNYSGDIDIKAIEYATSTHFPTSKEPWASDDVRVVAIDSSIGIHRTLDSDATNLLSKTVNDADYYAIEGAGIMVEDDNNFKRYTELCADSSSIKYSSSVQYLLFSDSIWDDGFIEDALINVVSSEDSVLTSTEYKFIENNLTPYFGELDALANYGRGRYHNRIESYVKYVASDLKALIDISNSYAAGKSEATYTYTFSLHIVNTTPPDCFSTWGDINDQVNGYDGAEASPSFSEGGNINIGGGQYWKYTVNIGGSFKYDYTTSVNDSGELVVSLNAINPPVVTLTIDYTQSEVYDITKDGDDGWLIPYKFMSYETEDSDYYNTLNYQTYGYEYDRCGQMVENLTQYNATIASKTYYCGGGQSSKIYYAPRFLNLEAYKDIRLSI